MHSQRLNVKAELFVDSVIVAGMVAVVHSIWQLFVDPPTSPQWLILAALTLLSGSFSVKLPGIPATISVSDFFVFTSILLFGAAPGTITVALDGLIISLWRNRGPQRAMFNMAAGAVSIWLASWVLIATGHSLPLEKHVGTSLFAPLILFAATYFVLNSVLVATAVSYEGQRPPYEVWRAHFPWLSLNYFASASIAGLLVSYMPQVNLAALGIIVPLWIVSYLTFKTAVERVEDTNSHLSQLNRMYLSTIETLAMAIDAKDQITHGHIRRVQAYAVGLAKAMGVMDESLIRAIEAAALLHDTGKLAVPEYILNKPGKLTPAEFERMKLHAAVGADILSTVDFPYPVVPIVRHHHENWDGKGYPDGLSGTNIPIGARILAVVDCFDALTSDRPYRPRLSEADAAEILRERRGTMYDPLVVDTFVQVYQQLDVQSARVDASQPVFDTIGSAVLSSPDSSRSRTSSLVDISASSDEMLTLHNLASALAGNVNVAHAGEIIAKHIRRLIPATICAFFKYDASRADLVVVSSIGDVDGIFADRRIDLGHGVAGWVGANRKSILNANPALDLGEVARTAKTSLRSTLAVPLIHKNALVGVLGLYSTSTEAFSDDHLRIAEFIAPQVARTLYLAAQFEDRYMTKLVDRATGLPTRDRLSMLLPFEARVDDVLPLPTSILLIRLRHQKQPAQREDYDHELKRLADLLRRFLRTTDLVFRYGLEELVLLLPQTDAQQASVIEERIRSLHAGPGSGRIGVGFAVAPSDGATAGDLARVAATRASPDGPDQSAVH